MSALLAALMLVDVSGWTPVLAEHDAFNPRFFICGTETKDVIQYVFIAKLEDRNVVHFERKDLRNLDGNGPSKVTHEFVLRNLVQLYENESGQIRVVVDGNANTSKSSLSLALTPDQEFGLKGDLEVVYNGDHFTGNCMLMHTPPHFEEFK